MDWYVEMVSLVAQPSGTERLRRPLESLFFVVVVSTAFLNEISRERQANIRCLCTFNSCQNSLWQTGRVNLHSFAIASCTGSADGHFRKRIAGLVPFFSKSCNNSNGSIMLVECRAEFLPRLSKGLAQGKCLQCQSIPFFLEHAKERRNRGERRRPGSNDAVGFNFDKVFCGKLLSRHGFFSMLGDISFNESFLKDTAYCNVRSNSCIDPVALRFATYRSCAR